MRREELVDVYAREINEESALHLFLKAAMYICKYEVRGQLPEASYFAPHFGRSVAREQFGIKHGVSYVARIIAVRACADRRELLTLAAKERGRTWLRGHRHHIEGFLRRFPWRQYPGKRSIVFLGEPRLIFNPPIPKERLMPGRGFLSRRTFSFDELFHAWGDTVPRPRSRKKRQSKTR